MVLRVENQKLPWPRLEQAVAHLTVSTCRTTVQARRGVVAHLVAAEDSRAGHLSRQVVLIRAVYRWLVGAEGGSSALWRPLRL